MIFGCGHGAQWMIQKCTLCICDLVEAAKQKGAEEERTRLLARLRAAGARMAYHVAEEMEREG